MQILTRAMNFRGNLTACRQTIFLTRHLSLSQLLKLKGGPFDFNRVKLGLDTLSSYHCSSRNHTKFIVCLSPEGRVKKRE